MLLKKIFFFFTVWQCYRCLRAETRSGHSSRWRSGKETSILCQFLVHNYLFVCLHESFIEKQRYVQSMLTRNDSLKFTKKKFPEHIFVFLHNLAKYTAEFAFINFFFSIDRLWSVKRESTWAVDRSSESVLQGKHFIQVILRICLTLSYGI